MAMATTTMPAWTEQITVRGLLVSLLLGIIFSVISLKLTLTVGIIPSFNVTAGLLGFVFVKLWTSLCHRFGFLTKAFTRQENTVIQTCVVACYGIAANGSFCSSFLAMSKKMYNVIGPETPGNRIEDVKELSLGWITAFVCICSFVGLMVLVPVRRLLITNPKFVFPSGTATAVLINSFHTPEGEGTARKQASCLGKYFAGSFLWSVFKWFFSGNGSCGFEHFPSLGLEAYARSFYFDFNATYVAIGLICPPAISFSVLLGAIISWGFLWPFISSRAGDWYPAGQKSSDFNGLNGYKICLGTALILGDGMYNLVKIMRIAVEAFSAKTDTETDTYATLPAAEGEIEVQRRNEVFDSEGVPFQLALVGYLSLAALSVVTIPLLVPQIKWYQVAVCYVLAPLLAFCNAYAAGLTDFSLASTYAKLALFLFAAWGGRDGGVLAGLAASGVVMSVISTAADLMQDFKTGYLTLSSARSMFVSQLLGTFLGCIIAPVTFWVFWTTFDIGLPDGEYKSPSGVFYRQMAIVAVEGLLTLPKHCLELCVGHFLFSIGLNLVRDSVPANVSRFLPLPIAMGIPFYIGGFFGIDMVIGSLVLLAWQMRNKTQADLYAPAVASGLICGDGVWSLPSAILSLLKVNPPICMSFSAINS